MDHCTDKTQEIANNLNIKQLKILLLSNQEQGKKAALSKGIQSASGDFLVFTDADCRIPHKDWLLHMSGQSNTSNEVHIGISLIHPISHSRILRTFIQFETIQTAIQYIGSTILHLPYMSVGRNWGYSKELAKKLEGLTTYQHLIGGDDDLILQELIRKKAKVIPIIHPEAINYSIYVTNIKKWWKQKHRHVGIGLSYHLPFKIISGIPALLNGLFYLLMICLLIRGHFYFTTQLFIWRTIIFILTFALIGRKWKYSFSYIWIPFIDILYQCYILLSRLYTLVVPVKKWN